MSTGGLVLIGWLLDIAPLKSVWPGLVAMKANAALAFVFEGCALWMLGSDPADPFAGRRRRFGQVFASIVVLIGLLTLGEYFFGWDLGDRKSTRLNSSHANNSYAVFCLKKKNTST